MYSVLFSILCGFSTLPGILPAIEQSLPPSISVDSSTTDTGQVEKTEFVLLPIFFSSPDTRLAIGILPQIVFRTSSASNPSSVRMDSYYTQNKQYHLLLRPRVWLRDNSYSLTGKFSLKKWPTSFYGIGNASTSDKQKFTEQLYESSIEAMKNIGKGYFTGLNYALRYGKINPESPEARSTLATVSGHGTTLTSSIGFLFRQDTRDNHFYPRRGDYHTLEFSVASKLMGSDHTFAQFTADFHKYIPIHRSHVLAVQGLGSVSVGDLPFRLLPSVGSTMRGYSSVRYIDRNLAALQIEYRVAPLFGRIGFVAFAGVADVFEHPDDLHLDKLKYAVGIGIRYLFSRSKKINIRLDYGIGRRSSGNYVDLGEAF
ncbi:outer membrane protein assembly factor [Aliifodinibius sp. S!AR15-10]|uniref:BamA/TamA family outer membrane protein n=1 Tax=Aliifodinibius sp. S!AR15-10 TaxID=2950437 RepID=UPI002857AEEF|nr:BamA/TamA family outer membrane protein [Aliifodinibius sp. S!AR15-10]MDR8390883.1 outer membrane protein assembly factor [Aliifodinibius sp. S!AR15-10]